MNPGLSERRTTGNGHREHRRGGNRGHWLAMFLCCVPVVLIVGFLYLTGAVGSGAVVAVIVCVAMMPLMHGAMSHGDRGGKDPGG